MKLTFPGGQEFTLLSLPIHDIARVRDANDVSIPRDQWTYTFAATDRSAIEALVKDGAWPNVQRDNLTALTATFEDGHTKTYPYMYIFLDAMETSDGKYRLKLASMHNAAEVEAVERMRAAQAARDAAQRQATESAEALAVMLGDKPIEEGLA